MADYEQHISQGRGNARTRDKADRATTDQVLDPQTRMILYKLINRGVISKYDGAISTGKEANVYGGEAEIGDENLRTVHRAIKVYKTAILVFKDRERYIAGEHRFQRGYNKSNPRKMVKLWAEKEFRNLKRIHAAGIPCPEPLALKRHVLVMSFLGDGKGRAYPRLRDANVAGDDLDQQWRRLYIQLLGYMRQMFGTCNLVHADLSEYNILYHDGTLYIIDVSQSVEPNHPHSLEFLRMDIKNVGDFFGRKGVDILDDRTIFHYITDAKGPLTEPALSAEIERLYENRPEAVSNEEAAAQLEIDMQVFRNQFMPQNLDQVPDFEADGERIQAGEGGDLAYKAMLADGVVAQGDEDEDDSGDSSDDDSLSGAELEGEGSDDESRFEKGVPRGRKFEDKDEKRQHKAAVKEAKREKRKEKVPKHVKKRMVATTSRKK
jgi:RIO kinase 1